MAKAMKSEKDGKHPSSHYLVVEDATKPSTWHLRVRNVKGDVDRRLMGAAWAALHGGFRGNKYQGPNKAEAITKLKKLYKSEGVPVPGNSTKAMVYKDAAGQLWFFGVYSNNFEDREGDIFEWEGHKEYAEWVKRTGIKLPITIMHQPRHSPVVHMAQLVGLNTGILDSKEFSDNYYKLYKPTAFAQTEMILPLNGFMFVVGKVLKDKENVAESLMNAESAWAMSHGFIKLKTSGNIINKYRTFELSVLPPALAANALTLFDVRENRKMDEFLKGLSEENAEMLKEMLGVDPKELEDTTEVAQQLLSKVLASKQLEKEAEDTEEVEATAYDAIRTKLFSELDVEGLHKTIQLVVDKVLEFEGRLTSTEKSEDEKIAEKLFEPDWKNMWGETTGEDDQDVVDELKKDALGDDSVVDKAKVASENPINRMFWGPLMDKRQ